MAPMQSHVRNSANCPKPKNVQVDPFQKSRNSFQMMHRPVFSETGSHCRLFPNSWSSCLRVLRTEITGMHHHGLLRCGYESVDSNSGASREIHRWYPACFCLLPALACGDIHFLYHKILSPWSQLLHPTFSTTTDWNPLKLSVKRKSSSLNPFCQQQGEGH